MTLSNPVFVWASDIHINSKQALSTDKEIALGDDDYYRPNIAQKALHTAWIDAWKEVKSIAGKRPLVVCFGGEIIDMDAKNRSNQFITRDEEAAQDHALKVIAPVCEMASKIIVLRGTEAHVGQNGAMDEAIGKRIHKEYKNVHKNTTTKEYSWHHFRGFIGGRKFDLAHHVSMGNMPRTERNAANHLASDLMMTYGRWKEALPDFAIRGHVHRVSDSSMNYPVRAMISGCWQLPTSFIHRIGKGGDKPDIGLICIDVTRKDVRFLQYDYKRENPEHI